ncbi:3-isopropylmalate dehydratase small subunit [Sporomusa sp.]|jgi:3-isopropylmalate/(R)-2-methylmalate dehydratase small subunit|uniref:3-isopropylmalate dehydratase small subunit n=1 Tax=Sporomusa sp. TaxID=2078658 RepID=UPI002C21E125|nr:3-isopropylmalate dehydratase small subunit [Sporomusa sp.]MDF2874041.1 dmdB 2 [Sporomusa sp.]HWR08084.1 3-isopropylmalate dehydratase small subunit [Sporomusa sp.]
MQFSGKVWRYGDNVDTDVIIPARYLNTANMQELAVHAMEDIDPSFAGKVQQGDIIVAGKNFGCGSSREHAPGALKAAGIACVVAESFARIFYRNAINIGLPLIELGEGDINIKAGDTLTVDLDGGTAQNLATGEEFIVPALPGFIQEIAQAGGLVNYTRQVLAAKEGKS